MPTMAHAGYTGTVTWMGFVPAKTGLQAEPRSAAEFTFDGLTGERHMGTLRPSCVRMTMLYPKGTEIRNVRQLTILSREELDAIAAEMGLETLDPRYLGANLVVSGIPDFTHVPPSARLQGPSGLTLTIDTENQPCVLPGREIETDHGGYGTKFKGAAKDRRGVTAWVERPGSLAMGDALELFVPTQRGWTP